MPTTKRQTAAVTTEAKLNANARSGFIAAGGFLLAALIVAGAIIAVAGGDEPAPQQVAPAAAPAPQPEYTPTPEPLPQQQDTRDHNRNRANRGSAVINGDDNQTIIDNSSRVIHHHHHTTEVRTETRTVVRESRPQRTLQTKVDPRCEVEMAQHHRRVAGFYDRIAQARGK